MSKKPCKIVSWFKRQWKGIILVLFGIVLLVGNICVLIYVTEDKGQSSWLTLISGWISGVATLIVGLIAFWQNNKFTFDTRKRDLILEITNFMSEFQENFVATIDIEDLYRINHQIFELTLKNQDQQSMAYELIKINRDLLGFTKATLKFESILLKGCFYSQDIINLHKTLILLNDKLNEYDLEDIGDLTKAQYNQGYYDEVSKFITDWSSNFFNLAKDIMVHLQKMKLEILSIRKLKDLIAIEEASYKEEKTITDYFNVYVEGEQNNG